MKLKTKKLKTVRKLLSFLYMHLILSSFDQNCHGVVVSKTNKFRTGQQSILLKIEIFSKFFQKYLECNWPEENPSDNVKFHICKMPSFRYNFFHFRFDFKTKIVILIRARKYLPSETILCNKYKTYCASKIIACEYECL